MLFFIKMILVIKMLDGEKLKELMREKNIKNVRELSYQTGLSCTTLYYMIAGHDMYVSSLVTLSKFFDVPIDYLVKKYYGVMCYSEDKQIFINTSSLIEATFQSMMQ